MVFVFIGGNDFINAMHAPDPEAALRAALPRALANYQLAVRTIRAANPDVRLVLATVPDIRLLPEFDGPLREGRLPVRLADACTAAMESVQRPDSGHGRGRPEGRGARPGPGRSARRPGEPRLRHRGGEEAGSVPPRQLPGSLLPGRPPAPRDPGAGRAGPDVHPHSQCPIRRRDRAAPRRRDPRAGRRSAGGAGGSSPSWSGGRETPRDPAGPGPAGRGGLGRISASPAR